MVQIISIAFQLAGALILLMWSIRGARKIAIIERCFPGSNIAERDEENNCTIEKNKLRKVANEVYLNIVAFIDLVIGYLVAYFSISNYNPVCAIAYTVALTAFIIVLEILIVRLIAALRFKQDEIVPYSDLEKAGVDTVPTTKEIDEWFS